jgi:hypothetical protein
MPLSIQNPFYFSPSTKVFSQEFTYTSYIFLPQKIRLFYLSAASITDIL